MPQRGPHDSPQTPPIPPRCNSAGISFFRRSNSESDKPDGALLDYGLRIYSCGLFLGDGMSEFKPISTVADLDLQDSKEMVDGYRDGLNGTHEPGSDKSRSYWHGWRNGMRDTGRIPSDSAMDNLAEEYVRRQKAH